METRAVSREQFIQAIPPIGMIQVLRKSRARLMIGALQSKQVVKGNLSIRFSNNTFTFNYRGTDIMQWNMSFDTISEVFCGSHETSPSTRNQRKMAREAIEEFKERLL